MGLSLLEALEKTEQYLEGGPPPKTAPAGVVDVPTVSENDQAVQNDLALSELARMMSGV